MRGTAGDGARAGGGHASRPAQHIPGVRLRSRLLRRLALAAATLPALAACEESLGPGGRQANAIWTRDFAPATRATVVAGGPGTVAIATGDSLLVLDNAIGTRLWGAAWRDTLAGGAITSQLVVAPTRRGAVVFNRTDGAVLARDTSDAPSAFGTVAVAVRDSIAVLVRDDGAARAIVARTGRELWRTPARCNTAGCGTVRAVVVRPDVVVTSGRLLDGTGSFLQAHRLATGAVVPIGFPARPAYAVNITATGDTVDLVVMDQTNDSLFVTRGITGTIRLRAGLRLQAASPPPPLIGEPSPIAFGPTIVTANRGGATATGTAFSLATGDIAWQLASFIPLGTCGTRYLAADPEGYRLYEATTGAVYLRIAAFATNANPLPVGTPRRPVTAGDIVLAYTSPTAVRVFAC